MSPLSLRNATHRAAMLLLGGLLSLMAQACHGSPGLRSRPWQAYALPTARTAGDWQAPREPAERDRMNAVLEAYLPSLQDCMWRYAGVQLSRLTDEVAPRPLVATFGVDTSGKVVWLEMEDRELDYYSLRECLSEQLARLRFDPPPSSPTLLILVLPPLQSRGRTASEPYSYRGTVPLHPATPARPPV